MDDIACQEVFFTWWLLNKSNLLLLLQWRIFRINRKQQYRWRVRIQVLQMIGHHFIGDSPVSKHCFHFCNPLLHNTKQINRQDEDTLQYNNDIDKRVQAYKICNVIKFGGNPQTGF